MAVKRTVAIFSNYEATEKTFCAMYLADYTLARKYRHLLWIVPDKPARTDQCYGFSHKWDTGTLSLKTQEEKIKKLLHEPVRVRRNAYVPACELCLFFEENHQLHSLLPDCTRSVLLLDHHKWQQETSREFAKKCAHLLSPSKHTTKKIVPHNLFTNDILCPFDSTLQMVPKVHIQSGHDATLFYPAYGMTYLERQCLQRVAEIVKECCPKTKGVIGRYDAWATSTPGNDAKVYDWRLLDYLKQTDWIIDLNPRPLLGLFGSFAGALGIQWSCFDIAPNNDDYSGTRRHLIPLPRGGLVLKNADEIAGHIVRQLTATFNSDTDRNRDVGMYAKRLKDFYRAMNKIFGSKNR